MIALDSFVSQIHKQRNKTKDSLSYSGWQPLPPVKYSQTHRLLAAAAGSSIKGSESRFSWFTVVHIYWTQSRENRLNAMQFPHHNEHWAN